MSLCSSVDFKTFYSKISGSRLGLGNTFEFHERKILSRGKVFSCIMFKFRIASADHVVISSKFTTQSPCTLIIDIKCLFFSNTYEYIVFCNCSMYTSVVFFSTYNTRVKVLLCAWKTSPPTDGGVEGFCPRSFISVLCIIFQLKRDIIVNIYHFSAHMTVTPRH